MTSIAIKNFQLEVKHWILASFCAKFQSFNDNWVSGWLVLDFSTINYRSESVWIFKSKWLSKKFSTPKLLELTVTSEFTRCFTHPTDQFWIFQQHTKKIALCWLINFLFREIWAHCYIKSRLFSALSGKKRIGNFRLSAKSWEISIVMRRKKNCVKKMNENRKCFT